MTKENIRKTQAIQDGSENKGKLKNLNYQTVSHKKLKQENYFYIK